MILQSQINELLGGTDPLIPNKIQKKGQSMLNVGRGRTQETQIETFLCVSASCK